MNKLKLKNLDSLPLRESVFLTLREAILKGYFKPGDRLMEVDLANELGVSRTPVREAIRKLELEGLVDMRPKRGAKVSSITLEDLNDVMEIRRHLEKLVVELSCVKATEEDVKEMEKCQQAFVEAVKSRDSTKIAEADVAFHDVIYKSTYNKRLIQILNNLHEQMYRYRLEYIKDEMKRTTLVEEHNRLITAIKEHDIDNAKCIIIRHVDNQHDTIVKNMSKEEK